MVTKESPLNQKLLVEALVPGQSSQENLRAAVPQPMHGCVRTTVRTTMLAAPDKLIFKNTNNLLLRSSLRLVCTSGGCVLAS